MNLFIISQAFAHEEGATTLTTGNILGPLLAIIIIVLAIVVAKRINPIRSRARAEGASPEDRGAATSNGVKKIKKENNYEQRN